MLTSYPLTACFLQAGQVSIASLSELLATFFSFNIPDILKQQGLLKWITMVCFSLHYGIWQGKAVAVFLDIQN